MILNITKTKEIVFRQDFLSTQVLCPYWTGQGSGCKVARSCSHWIHFDDHVSAVL